MFKTITILIQTFSLAFLLLLVMGCSSTPQITKWTSPDLRVAVDPMGIDSENYIRIESALVKTKRFFVVDRGAGFKAAVREQDHTHGVSYSGYEDNIGKFNRYGDSDRYAKFGRLFGVGSIIVASTRCDKKRDWWKGAYMDCSQHLALINSSTGEVVAAVSGKADDAEDFYDTWNVAASWDNTVAALIEQIPEDYTPSQYSDRMRLIRSSIREDSIRRREQIESESK